MDIVEELQRDHQMLRGKLELLQSALALAPESWFVLREISFVLWRRLQVHSEREAEALAACHSSYGGGALAHILFRHDGSLQALSTLNQLLVGQSEEALETVRSVVRAVISHLKQECHQQEAHLFPLLEQMTEAPAADVMPLQAGGARGEARLSVVMKGLVVSLLTAVLCATGGAATGWAQTASATPMVVSGKLASVDPKQNLVTLKMGLFATQTFAVDAEAKITQGNKHLPLERLPLGSDVTITYVNERNQHIAQSIDVQKKPAKERAPARP